jgi:hypothetical protein
MALHVCGALSQRRFAVAVAIDASEEVILKCRVVGLDMLTPLDGQVWERERASGEVNTDTQRLFRFVKNQGSKLVRVSYSIYYASERRSLSRRFTIPLFCTVACCPSELPLATG